MTATILDDRATLHAEEPCDRPAHRLFTEFSNTCSIYKSPMNE
jgi:hypothetical protein